MSDSLWQRIEAARSRWNVLEHSFYRRWSAGELELEELGYYAGEYRHAVTTLAATSAAAARAASGDAGRVLARHAAEEAAHVALWDEFVEAVDGSAGSQPAPQTEACVRAWSCDDLLGSLVTMYAIESGQPEISTTKRDGLISFYGMEPGPATAYFDLHAKLDAEHAEEARGLIESAMDDARVEELAAIAERTFEGNWALLDGVEERTAELRRGAARGRD